MDKTKLISNNKKYPLVYIIILNYINYQDTIECVESLKMLNYPNYKVIIIDNASPNESELILKRRYKEDYIVLQSGENLKYAGGNNFAVSYILKKLKEPKYILILNNDTKIIDKQMLAILVKYAVAIKDLGVMSPKIIKPNGKEDGPYTKPTILNCIFNEVFFPFAWLTRIIKRYIKKISKTNSNDYINIFNIYRPSGSCMLIKFSNFIKVGMFDCNTNFYAEETILAEKLILFGYNNYYFTGTSILHKHSKSISLLYSEKAKYYEMLKSNLYYFLKYKNYNRFKLDIIKISSMIFANVYLPVICLLKRTKYRK
jgi:GT2 family glycosyltransferase